MNNIVAFNPCFVCPKDGKCSMCELNMYRQGTLSNPQWISVNDRLPEDGEYLTYGHWDYEKYEDGSVTTRTYCVGWGGWLAVDGYIITHWMPLPEAPKMIRKEDEGK